MNKFRLPIGDWSGDGHSQCKYYTVSSNKPISEVREAHYKIEETTGINIEELANVYEENWIESEDVEKLVNIGFYDYINTIEGYSYMKEYAESIVDKEGEEGRDYEVDEDIMAHLWLFLLTKADPELKFELEEPLEMLPFFGRDKKGRHISFVGYGLFC